MPSDTRENFPHHFLSCHWPQEFKSRRRFFRQLENEPFVEYLQKHPERNRDDGAIESSDTYEDNSDENDESEEDESEDDDSEEDEDEEDDGEEENQYGDEEKEMEEYQSHQTGDKNAEAWNSRSTIRKFMEGLDEEALTYPDQVAKVVDFCEQGSSTESKKYVALLNDTNDGGTGPKKRPYCRPYKGPLTSQRFRDELEKAVI